MSSVLTKEYSFVKPKNIRLLGFDIRFTTNERAYLPQPFSERPCTSMYIVVHAFKFLQKRDCVYASRTVPV